MTAMMITLTRQEMLAQWKLRRALEPLRADCMAQRNDGIDLDRYLTEEMRSWYLRMLDTAPVEMTGWTEIAGEVAVTVAADGSGEILLPENCRRVIEVRLEGWKRQATIVTDSNTALAVRQQSRFTRGGTVDPVAVLSGRRLRLYTPPAGMTPAIATLRCVTVPRDDCYTMDERALELLYDDSIPALKT